MSNLSLLQFRSRLLLIVGALPIVACGGKVRFNDGDDGGGGGGGNGNGGSGGSSSSIVITGGGGWCGDSSGLDYLCFESDTCPGYTTPQTAANIEAALMDECNQGGCGCKVTVDFLSCGPDPNSDLCCYFGAATIEDDFCEGRPFVVDGATRTASLEARSDWAEARELDLAALTETERAALAQRWEESALFEHASVASFSRFLLELLSLGAPPDLVREAATALRDEVRHAELCFGIASALRGTAVGPGVLDTSQASDAPPRGAEEIVYAAAREGCIGETLSALVAQAALEAATDPGVRLALSEIVADELRHAELAWRFVAWACANDAPGSVLEGARAGAARAFAAPPSFEEADLPEGLRPEVARAFGFLSRSERRAHAKRAFDLVIAPARHALLADAGVPPRRSTPPPEPENEKRPPTRQRMRSQTR
jgi:hypothetical protein